MRYGTDDTGVAGGSMSYIYNCFNFSTLKKIVLNNNNKAEFLYSLLKHYAKYQFL